MINSKEIFERAGKDFTPFLLIPERTGLSASGNLRILNHDDDDNDDDFRICQLNAIQWCLQQIVLFVHDCTSRCTMIACE